MARKAAFCSSSSRLSAAMDFATDAGGGEEPGVRGAGGRGIEQAHLCQQHLGGYVRAPQISLSTRT